MEGTKSAEKGWSEDEGEEMMKSKRGGR